MDKDLEFNVSYWYESDENLDEVDEESQPGKFKNYSDRYVLRLFGRTQDGQSVCARLDNFTPHFYVKIFSRWSDRDVDKFVFILKGFNKKFEKSLIGHEIVTRSDFHFGFCGGKKFKFVKLVFDSVVASKAYARYISNNKIKLSGIEPNPIQLETYESKIDPFVRLIHLKELDSAGWIVLPGGKYQTNLSDRTSTDINVRIFWNDIKPLQEVRGLAPFVIASYDIETYSCDGSFPQASRSTDAIISICTTFTKYGSDTIIKSVAIGLKSSSKISNADEQYMFETEEQVLLAWKDLILREDPDIITGYNIKFFDNKYLNDRACHPRINCLRKFSQLSRIQGYQCKFEEKRLSSSGLGDNLMYQFAIIGRIEIDLMKMVQQDHKLTSYKLDKVAEHFMKQKVKKITLSSHNETYNYRIQTDISKLKVGNYVKIEEDGIVDEEKIEIKALYPETSELEVYLEQEYFLDVDPSHVNICLVKDDMPIQELFACYKKGPEDRALIHQYCIQDCALVSKLLHKLDIITQRFAMASVSYVSVDYILMRGQGIKALSLFGYTCAKEGYLIKDLKPPPQDPLDTNKVGYEGATVFTPIKGFYTRPIAVLDFNSLYPNSEREMDMSPENLVRDPQYEGLPDYLYREVNYSIKENGVEVGKQRCVFATHKSKLNAKGVQQSYGIVGSILTKLLTERKIAKKNMEKATDPFIKNIYDGKQLALKVTANSIYGQFGAPTSPIYCKDIAASTTAVGRMRLEQAKAFVEDDFTPILLSLYNAWAANDDSTVNKILDAELEDRSNQEFIDTILKPTVMELYANYMTYPQVIYGDTDSNFYDFKITHNETKQMPTDRWCRKICICLGLIASKLLKTRLPSPQNMEFEKVCHPLSMMEKKKYIYNKYDDNPDKFKRVVMGYTLKRRDNATIVHRVLGRAVEIAMDEQDTEKAIKFLIQALNDILDGKYPIEDFITTKTLRANYKGTKLVTDDKGKEGDEGSWFWDDVNCSIAHVKLCQRMKARDPGNCPQINDRIPFVTIALPNSKKMLQADRIEHPDYIIANKLKVDYLFYITNQIMNPCIQFFELITDKLGLIFNEIIDKETDRNEKMFDQKARVAGLKKLEKFGITVSENKNNDDWDPDAGFASKTKSSIPVDEMLAAHSVNKLTASRAKKEAKIAKATTKSVGYTKRKNKVLDLLIAEMNENMDNIKSINLDDILSKMN
jgi:DNA polymerase elongation subunit (family B)